MNIEQAIAHVVERRDLKAQDIVPVMRQIMTGAATPIQIGGFLAALRTKGETIEEIVGAASVMREMAARINVDDRHLVDTCGTGGDGARLFNVSTACAFVVAAGGGRVAKHGNRSMSSSSGSADVLESLGVRIDLPPEKVADAVEKLGIGFMFAPAHHSAARHAAAPRKELGVRTLFNLLGPLTNPAAAPHQLLGVFSRHWIEPLAQALKELGSRHVLVVHSEDGLDELSIAAPTHIAELKGGAVSTWTLKPEEVGVSRGSVDALGVDNPAQSAVLIKGVLDGNEGPAREIVVLNAGAALYAADVVESIAQGVERARSVIDSGAAREKMLALREFGEAA